MAIFFAALTTAGLFALTAPVFGLPLAAGLAIGVGVGQWAATDAAGDEE